MQVVGRQVQGIQMVRRLQGRDSAQKPSQRSPTPPTHTPNRTHLGGGEPAASPGRLERRRGPRVKVVQHFGAGQLPQQRAALQLGRRPREEQQAPEGARGARRAAQLLQRQ